MTWKVQEVDGERSRECTSKTEAQEIKSDMEGLGMDVEILTTNNDGDVDVTFKGGRADGGAEVVEPMAPERNTEYNLPDKPPVDTDPLTWMPAGFTDTIDGTVAINRKGFSVLKQHYDIDVQSDCVVGPEETDFTFCRHKAVATAPDGTVSEAHGSAHVDRGDDPWLLLEMSDTRAKKRALSDATGVGMVAVSELQNQP